MFGMSGDIVEIGVPSFIISQHEYPQIDLRRKTDTASHTRAKFGEALGFIEETEIAEFIESGADIAENRTANHG